MRFASLGSGSKGNCTIVECNTTNILIDCGFSLKSTTTRLEQLNKSPEDLTAILVSHEHSDHWKGVEDLSSKFNVPVYLSAGTYKAKNMESNRTGFHIINNHNDFVIGDFTITPVPVPHDAREPIQYVFKSGSTQFGIITDLGHYTTHIVECYSNCNGILIECNYDEDMLNNGPYPKFLKQRVSGLFGHLSNSQAADLLSRLDCSGLQQLVIGHVSKENNCGDIIRERIGKSIPVNLPVHIATQTKVSEWFSLA